MDAANETRPDTSRDTTITVTDAAQRLQVTEDAVRKRLQRGTLKGVKTGGTWDVIETEELKDATPTGTATTHDTVSGRPENVPVATDSALVQHLQGEIAYLRGELSSTIRQLAAERERSDILQLTATIERDDDAPGSSVSDHTDDQDYIPVDTSSDDSGGAWARLRRWWKGQTVR
jgi:excisionase family DNA binding protein